MRISLCLFGLLGGMGGRDGAGGTIAPEEGYKYYKTAFFDHYNVDVFIHTWSKDYKDRILSVYKPQKALFEEKRAFEDVKLINYGIKDVAELKNDIRYIPIVNSQPENELESYLTSLARRSHSRWLSTKKVLELKDAYEQAHQFKYDFTFLGRFDMWFKEKFVFDEKRKDIILASPRNFDKTYRDDEPLAIQDLWLFGSSENISKVGKLYDSIYQYCIRPPYAIREHIKTKIGDEHLKYYLWQGLDYGLIRLLQ
ncbi:hypothetical protein [uncultured Desulfobacter sp.]|uniref:hypothetical protein n=1 Tax=uncultured Desulfobacter sp. TaxID=240139 RepID=UPI002AAB2854|nr:hypothetical protein [uncultured Desulfobacter sp.]